jgi:hypothetical protein
MSVVDYRMAGLGRFRNLDQRERWGYGVWLFAGAVIAVGELWAAVGSPWWVTISATTGHLEQLWSPVKIIVVALVAAGAASALRYPPSRAASAASPRSPAQWRTGNGRITRKEGGQADQLTGLYLLLAVTVVAAGGTITAALGAGKFTVGYVIYGLMAAGLLIVPSVLAYWFAKDVPFPTLFRALSDLEKRCHAAVTVVVAGLAVLAVHLVAYPWP